MSEKIFKPLSSLIIMLILISSPLYSQTDRRCAFEEQFEALSQDQEFMDQLADFEEKQRKGVLPKSESVFVIPTVVHVIYKTPEQNISDAQIQSQIDALNNDFRKLNADTNLVDADFTAADVKIEFCLAKRDPQGNPTTGINRIDTTFDFIGTNDQYYRIQPAWDRNHYLNIWVGVYGNNIIGRASPPNEPNANKDGVIITHTAFGTQGTAAAPYNKGRTTTHEVGHWLGLFHIWGTNDANPNCAQDDQVSDTPDQDTIYYDCQPSTAMSCGSKDMATNYMGYVDDICMANFSEGQKERMRNSLVLQRPSLLLSKGCLPVGLNEQRVRTDLQLYPNPVNDQLTIKHNGKLSGKGKYRLFDLNGRSLIERKISFEGRELNISTTEINSGVYLLELSDQRSIYRSKLIIQH